MTTITINNVLQIKFQVNELTATTELLRIIPSATNDYDTGQNICIMKSSEESENQILVQVLVTWHATTEKPQTLQLHL